MTKTMTQSLNIPFFMSSDECDITELMALRKELKKQHKNLSLLPFFLKACSLAMHDLPLMNVHVNPALDEEGYIKEYVMKKDHNFSIAIDSVHGLIVPVVKKVQEKSIL